MDRVRPVLCAGSALWDVIARTDRAMRPGHDVPGRIARQPGGVALNVALALAEREVPVGLLSTIGTDAEGAALVTLAERAGVRCAHVARDGVRTDVYMAIEHAGGEVFAAVADCTGLERRSEAVLAPLRDGRIGAPGRPYAGLIVLDGNFPEAVLDRLPEDPTFAAAHIALVPASPGKAARLRHAMRHPDSTLYVNRTEAEIILDRPFPNAAAAADALTAAGASTAVVTDGAAPAAAAGPAGRAGSHPPPVDARTTTGAGDAFLAAHLDATRDGAAPQAALDAAVAAAAAHIAEVRG